LVRSSNNPQILHGAIQIPSDAMVCQVRPWCPKSSLRCCSFYVVSMCLHYLGVFCAYFRYTVTQW
jgi:hypothetical protein